VKCEKERIGIKDQKKDQRKKTKEKRPKKKDSRPKTYEKYFLRQCDFICWAFFVASYIL